jgi:hypothetical protein
VDVGRGPITLGDATAVRDAREAQRAKLENAKKDNKQKNRTTPLSMADGTAPGTHVGDPAEQGAYWMLMEVRSPHRIRYLFDARGPRPQPPSSP